MNGCKKYFISPLCLLVVLLLCGFVERCSARKTLRVPRLSGLDSSIQKQRCIEINPAQILVGAQPHTRQKRIVHVRRSLERHLYSKASDLFNSINESAGAWLKPEHEASWKEKRWPRQVLLEYGDLACSGKTKQLFFLLSNENVEYWKNVPAIRAGYQEAVREWFENNVRIEGESISDAFDRVFWSAKRAKSTQRVWWNPFQIEEWARRTEKWQTMIEIGDLLGFYDRDITCDLGASLAKTIKISLRNKLYEIEPSATLNTKQPAIWGRFQVCQALKEAVIADLKVGKSLYNIRVENLLDTLGPDKPLGEAAANLHLEQSNEDLVDLELHWLLSGLDPVEAKMVGIAIAITRHRPPYRHRHLTHAQKNCLKAFKSLIKQRVHGVSPVEKWYMTALGPETYYKVARKMENKLSLLKQDTKYLITSLSFLWTPVDMTPVLRMSA